MPRKPALRYCKTNRRWRVTMNRRTFWFTRDYGESVGLFAAAFRKEYGREPAARAPLTVASLVLAWLEANGHCTDPDKGGWSKRERWNHDMIVKFAELSGADPLDDIKSTILTDYHAWCIKNDYSANTIRHYLTFADRVLRWGVTKGFVEAATWDKPQLAKPKYIPKDLSRADLISLLEHLDSNPRRRHAARITRFILETGARPIEARLLQWRHVRLDVRTCQLAPSEHKTGYRTGEGRTLYLTDTAAAMLGKFRPKDAKPDDFVFLSSKGEPYTRDGLYSILNRGGASAYSLRHTAAQAFVDQKGDVAALQVRMGHKSSETTAQYARVRDQRVHDALREVKSPLQLVRLVEPRDASFPKQSPKKSKRRRKSPPKTQKRAKAQRLQA